MILDTLLAAAERNELILLDGAMCRWHLQRDGTIVLQELIVLPARQRQGLGTAILAQLARLPGARTIRARIPARLYCNTYFHHLGFRLARTERGHSGSTMNVWTMTLHTEPALSADEAKEPTT